MKRTALRPISDRMKRQKVQEHLLKARMIRKHGRRCMSCGIRPSWVDKHEIIPRSRWRAGALEEDNCVLLCRRCHDKEKATPPELRRKKSEYPFITTTQNPPIGVESKRRCPMTYPQIQYRPRIPSLLRQRSPYPDIAYRLPVSLLRETMETAIPVDQPCQIVSPRYYDLLSLFNIPMPDYSFITEPETRERKIDEILQKLKDGVSRIQDSAVFREWLLTMAKFHEYSLGNQILIMIQSPTATRVAGFYTWKDLGRWVKAGEKGIAILAPCLAPRGLVCPVCGQAGGEKILRAHVAAAHPGVNATEIVRQAKEGAPAGEAQPTFFKVVYVFDVSQTQGKELPRVEAPPLTGDANPELFARAQALAKSEAIDVSFEPRPEMNPDIKGSYIGKSIWVKPDESSAQQLKTLLHELAHYYTESVFGIPRQAAETIAESSAFSVAAHFGFDTGTRSFPYVATWAQDKKVLDQNMGNVRKVTAKMIPALEAVTVPSYELARR